MSKKIIIISSIFILAVFGGVWYLLSTEQDPIDNSSQVSSTTSVPTESNEIATTESTDEAISQESVPGTYETYDVNKLANASGTKVLFFHAPWCPQCRAIEEDITPETLPNNVSIFKVDYDSNQELRQKYGVTLQTTFVVVDDQGNLVKKHVAYSEPTFEAVKQALF